MDRYGKNIEERPQHLSTAEGNLRSAMDILQRVRELAVQGANGTLDKSQMGYIGDEVNQLLEELLTIANSKDQSGNSLFAGTLSKTTPFRTTTGRVPGGSGDMVVSVDYLGNIGQERRGDLGGREGGGEPPRQRRILGGAAADLLHRGRKPVPGARQHSTIRIDGAEIHLAPGDTRLRHRREDQRRQRAGPRARGPRHQRPGARDHAARTRSGRRTWAAAPCCRTSAILAPGGNRPPLNVAPERARVRRIDLRHGDQPPQRPLRGVDGKGRAARACAGIEDSITNLAGVLGDVGARDARLDTVAKRLAYQKPELVRFDSQERDLDMADAITQLRTLEYHARGGAVRDRARAEPARSSWIS